MANKITLINDDGVIRGIDPETGEQIPVRWGETQLEGTIDPDQVGTEDNPVEVIYTDEATINEDNLDLGNGSEASDDNTTAIGGGARVYEGDGVDQGASESVAIGTNAEANHRHSTAVGHGAQALAATSDTFDSYDGSSDRRATAIGWNAQAIGHSSTALGAEARSWGRHVALGRWAEAIGKSQESGSGLGSGDIAVGYESHAHGGQNVVIGQEASNTSGGFEDRDPSKLSERNVVIGYQAATTHDNTYTPAVAIGPSASAGGRGGGTVVGREATGKTHSVAVGRAADAADEAIAIGLNAKATEGGSISIGAEASANSSDTMVVALGQSNVFELDASGNLKIAGELTEDATL
jgi:hypothetical protein